jgi:hypothetical protein
MFRPVNLSSGSPVQRSQWIIVLFHLFRSPVGGLGVDRQNDGDFEIVAGSHKATRSFPGYAVYALANPFICGYRESHYLFRDALQ